MANQYNQAIDEQLVEIVRSVDREAYSYIMRRYESKLKRYAYYLIGDEDIAADVVQESFINAYINLQSCDCRRSFSSWMYRIVHNQAMNVVKRKKIFVSTEEMKEIRVENEIEDAVIKQELVDHVHDCLLTLPLPYKLPLVLFFLEDKTYQEISDILRIPINTVATRINRAKGIIKKICQKKR